MSFHPFDSITMTEKVKDKKGFATVVMERRISLIDNYRNIPFGMNQYKVWEILNYITGSLNLYCRES